MKSSAILWLLFNILSIIVLAFYSMLEMACVSFNKVRLQYYVNKGVKRAIWLNYLLHNPSRLFGTTLIGVNIALVIGSECSREFYSAIGLSPDLAPLTQVILVVIFGELAPMFAARHYAEHVAMLGTPIIYASAKLMTPFLWTLGLISRICNLIVGGKESSSNIYLSQEELLKVLEEHSDEGASEQESDEFNAIAANIFNLRNKNVRKIMESINSVPMLPATATVAQMEALLAEGDAVNIPIYNRDISNIIAIAYPRDFLRVPDTHRVRDYARPPWFVPETASIMQILKQFRTNNESVAIALNREGMATGIIHLDDVLIEIFGEITYAQRTSPHKPKAMLIEKIFSGDTTVGGFNEQFGVLLDQDPTMTLSDLIQKHLKHHPEKGESIYIAPFEIKVKETTLVDVKTICISTRM